MLHMHCKAEIQVLSSTATAPNVAPPLLPAAAAREVDSPFASQPSQEDEAADPPAASQTTVLPSNKSLLMDYLLSRIGARTLVGELEDLQFESDVED